MQATAINQIETGEFSVQRWTNAPLQVEKVVVLNWPFDCVFELLSNHQRWPRIFPWLSQVSIDNSHAIIQNGLGAKRTCDMGNGMVLEEVIVGWQPPHMYAYAGLDETNPFGMENHLSVMQYEPVAENQMRLRWQHYFDHANPAAMRENLESSLEAAVQSLIANCGGKIEQTYLYQ